MSKLDLIGAAELLEDEFVRPEPPGLRPFFVGILKICRKLGLALATRQTGKEREITEEQAAREMLVIAWMLDERHPLDQVKLVPEVPRVSFEETIDDYEFVLEPARLLSVQKEVARASKSMAAANFRVLQKPGDKEGPAPPGNS